MKTLNGKFSMRYALAGASALCLMAAAYHMGPTVPDIMATAQAAEAGHSGGHGSAGHAGGHGGGGSAGHGGSHEEGSHDIGEIDTHLPGPKGFGRQGSHQGGHGIEMEHSGARDVETLVLRGRRPVWAQEGIPEVELGRLNVSRAPDSVLSRAEAEALSRFTPQMASLYDMSAAEAAQLLQTDYDQVTRIDSPVQNLALYKDVMVFGKTLLPGVHPRSVTDLAAIFLGSASDKTIPITENTVVAVNRILGLIELSPDERAALASKAESVRQAILIGHGETDH